MPRECRCKLVCLEIVEPRLNGSGLGVGGGFMSDTEYLMSSKENMEQLLKLIEQHKDRYCVYLSE
jgi:hypothetical protein